MSLNISEKRFLEDGMPKRSTLVILFLIFSINSSLEYRLLKTLASYFSICYSDAINLAMHISKC